MVDEIRLRSEMKLRLQETSLSQILDETRLQWRRAHIKAENVEVQELCGGGVWLLAGKSF